MSNFFHSGSRGISRSISEQSADLQQRSRLDKAVAQADIDSFSFLMKDACPSAPFDMSTPFDMAPSIDTQLPPRIRKSKSSSQPNAITQDLNGDGRRKTDSEKTGSGSVLWTRDDAASTARAKPAILLIHPSAVFRDCFAMCLEIAYEDHVVFSFKSVDDWRGSTEQLALTPAVAIIVVESGNVSSLVDLELLEETSEKMPVIVVSDIDDVDHIVRTLKRGARGYIPSNLPFNIAVEAVRLVEAGGVFVPASSFVDRELSSVPAKSGVMLTERQRAVIEEIRKGKANKQIAYELSMSEHTVKVHLRHIMRKLKARNRTEVAIFSENTAGSTKS